MQKNGVVMFILDTNVISEVIKKEPNNKVLTWLNNQTEENLYLSVVTLIEIKKGVCLLDESTKKEQITNWLNNSLLNRFENRWLDISQDISFMCGELLGSLQKKGIVLHVIDALIAATALVMDYQLVTRNIKDFEHTKVKLFNPWY